MEEATLIHQLKAGDMSAFEGLVATHRKKVLNICYRFLLNRQDAEDVSQEVFIEVFHAISHFKSQAKLSTWIYRIAVTKSLDEIKKRNRKKRISSLGKLLGLEQIAEWIYGTDQPDTTLEAKEEMQQLFEVLNELPENQRIALTLSKVEGYSHKEIAEIMDITLIAVDSLIYRGKQNLKTKLNK